MLRVTLLKNDSFANKGKQLWTGSWSSGSITVTNLRKYCLFAANIKDNATRMIAFMPPGKTQFRAFGLVPGENNNVRRYVLDANATSGSSNTLTYVKAVYFKSAAETEMSESNAIINEIWGII